MDEISAEELAEWRQQVVVLPNKMMSLEYLQSIYRDETQSLHIRMRAATIAIAYESPKLAVMATVTGQDFATLLDKRISHMKKVNAGLIAPPKERPPPELKPPPPQLRHKRFSRRI